ncbi:hypothetical protein C8J57DRAFT_1080656, partial [Mycena rebaudengoi]
MKASVKVAALNIKGNGNPNVRHQDNKWYELWQIMREGKFGVLIVGEAHMTDQKKADIDALFSRCMRLEFTKNPISNRRAGVAFVLNKNLVETEDIKTIEIVAGRALLLEMKNVDGSALSVLGVYAPNDPRENEEFWIEIKTWFIDHPRVRRPDIFGGDMNIVESGIDRLPAHVDVRDSRAMEALDDLKIFFRMIDGWRETYPATRAYTYHQSQAQGGAQSRIDRINIKRSLFEHTFEWDIQTAGIETDHRMVSVRLTTENAPTMGHGRWVWPAHIIRDKVLSGYIHEKGLALQKDFETIERWPARDPGFNAQTVWAKFKTDIGEKARERAKIIVPKIVQEIAVLETQLDLILADRTLTEEERKLSSVTVVEKLVQLQKQRYRVSRLSAQIRNRLEGEVISRYWSMINKPR